MLPPLSAPSATAVNAAASCTSIPTPATPAPGPSVMPGRVHNGVLPMPERRSQPALQAQLADAIRTSQRPQVRRLLAEGADPDSRLPCGETPLSLAACRADDGIVQDLLSAGAAPDKRAGQETPLDTAMSFSRISNVIALLDGGASVNALLPTGETPLMYAASVPGRHDGILDVVLAAGAALDVANPRDGWTALMCAAANGGADNVDALLTAGADVTRTSKGGQTALSVASDRATRTLLHDAYRQALRASQITS